MKSRLTIAHLLLIFALGVLPLAGTFILQYPDERHYTDGALTMLRDHDWLVPKTAQDNTGDWIPRFQKPPLAYWLTAASFQLFGANPLAARLPFVLACVGTLLLTWRLAQRLTGDQLTAQLATLVLLSHLQLILCAGRSMPDALLLFSVTLSAFGFLRVLALSEATTGAFAMAYGGAALAALSKGLLGVGIVLFAWAFVMVREKKLSAIKQLLHWPSLILATALTGAWFAAVFARYGMTAWHGFFDDQVTGNVRGSIFGPLWRIPVFALLLAVNFLPWSLPAFEARWRGGMTASPRLPVIARHFVFAWAGVLVVGFALGTNVSVRYLLPASPLMALWFADVLARAPERGLFFSTRRLLKVVVGLLLVLNLVAALIQLQWPAPLFPLLTVGLFAVGIVFLWLGATRLNWFSNAESLALAVLLIFPLVFFGAAPIALPDPCEQLAGSLRSAGAKHGDTVLFLGRPAMASGIRLMTQGHLRVVRTGALEEKLLGQFPVVLVPQREALQLQGRGYRIMPAAVIVRAPRPNLLWQAFRTRSVPDALQDAGEKYFIAAR